MNYFSYYKDRLLCMSQYLFQVEQENRLAQKGLLQRFTMKCYGVQPTLETIRAKKTEMFETLRNKKSNDPVKESWFLKYNPASSSEEKETITSTAPPKKKNTKVSKKTRKKKKTKKSKQEFLF